MPEAVYHGSAATYTVGPYKFVKNGPAVPVTEDVAKGLRSNHLFSIDGERAPARPGRSSESAGIPAKGFKGRGDAKKWAEKHVPHAVSSIDWKRSVAEIQRKLADALAGTLPLKGAPQVSAAAAPAPAEAPDAEEAAKTEGLEGETATETETSPPPPPPAATGTAGGKGKGKGKKVAV